MTYAIGASLQRAVFARLVGEAEIIEIVGPNIYDAVPPGTEPDVFVLIGEEVVRDRSTKTSDGAYHDFTVSVFAKQQGFANSKVLAAIICDSLLVADLSLDRGRVTGLWFRRARTRRGRAPDRRRIDLQFRAHVEDV